MNTMANRFESGDSVFASLTVDGKTLVSLSQNDFNSMNEVVRLIYSLAGKFAGMARLVVRNQSQGWCLTMPISSNVKREEPTSMYNEAMRKPRVENGQYLIPW